jgi:tartrate dehydrogenase/decarboxylase/D-malate dehydrogenase
VIPGDGIGQEVIPAALGVLEAVASRGGFSFDLVEFPTDARTTRSTAA